MSDTQQGEANTVGSQITAPSHDISPMYSLGGTVGFLIGPSEPGSSTGLHWFPQNIQGHALTFGTSRQGGKGTTTIIPALLTYAGSMVVIDPKGENAWITANRRRQLGHRVVIIDPWGEVNRRYGRTAEWEETVTRFNPLAALRADDANFADDVAAIADALIIPSGNDPHWTESASELITGLIANEVADNPGAASLRTVRYALTVSPEALATTAEGIVKDAPDSLAARKLGRFIKTSTELASIISTATTQTAILDSPALLDSMETEARPFNLAAVAREKVTVYLVIPPDRLQTHGRWLRMILTLTIRAVSRQDRPPSLPVVFMVDEAGTLNPVKGGGLKMLEQAFGLLAGLGVVVWMFFQDINQMKRDYPDSWETFIANSAMIQILNARDNTTTEYVAKYFGEKIMVLAAINGPNGSGSPARVERFPTLPAWSVRESTLQRQLVLFPGRGSHWCSKVHYYADPRFAPLYRENPLFPTRVDQLKSRPVQSINEAAAILAQVGWKAGRVTTGSMLRRSTEWQLALIGQPGRPVPESELIELAREVRNRVIDVRAMQSRPMRRREWAALRAEILARNPPRRRKRWFRDY